MDRPPIPVIPVHLDMFLERTFVLQVLARLMHQLQVSASGLDDLTATDRLALEVFEQVDASKFEGKYQQLILNIQEAQYQRKRLHKCEAK